MPLTLDEYERAQIYTTVECSLRESSKEEGVEIFRNEHFSNNTEMPPGYTSGQYTLKVYNLVNRFPFFIRALAPRDVMILNEDCWNAFPFSRTIVTNERMDTNFLIKIDTLYCEGRLDRDNAHELSKEMLDIRKVIKIDIANDTLSNSWKKDSVEPSEFVPKASNRGPLAADWIQTIEPIMTVYKLVQVKFKWFGLQRTVESFIMKTERKLFTSFHRYMYVWMDDWYDLTPGQLRTMEHRAEKELSSLSRRISHASTYAI